MEKTGALSRWMLRGRGAAGLDSVTAGAGSQTGGNAYSPRSDEISKKELLELTGLSYGQLYRWKRMQLIPESWFIRRAAFTGQETFFPRSQILERIETIERLKDRYSLEELAELLSPASATRRYARHEVGILRACPPDGLAVVDAVRRQAGRSEAPESAVAATITTSASPATSPASTGSAASTPVKDAPSSASGAPSSYRFVDLVAAAVAAELTARGITAAAVNETTAVVIAGAEQFSSLDELHAVCAVFGSERTPFAALYAGREPLVFGHGVVVLADVPLGPAAEAIRQELQDRSR